MCTKATNAGNDSSLGAVFGRSLNKDVVVVSGAKTPFPVVPKKDVSAGAAVVHDENALPNRPLTAFFTPQVRLPATDVFRAFHESNVNSSDVSCLQRTRNGQVLSPSAKLNVKNNFCEVF